MENMVKVVEDPDCDVNEAAKAEMLLIEEMRKMGLESLNVWAENKIDKTTEDAGLDPMLRSAGKKNSAGTRPLAKSK